MTTECGFLKIYNCALAFRDVSDAQGLLKFQSLKPEVQNKIFECLWKVRGSPTSISNPQIAHSDFGKISMFNQVTRCASTPTEKAQAIEMFLHENVAPKIQKEKRDAMAQQNHQQSFPEFSRAHFNRSSAIENAQLSKRRLYIAGGIALLFTILLIPLAIYLIWKGVNGFDLADEKTYIEKANRKIGIAHMQGKRDSMEDEHLVTDISFKAGASSLSAEIYGIFDGHGGSSASEFSKNHFADELKKSLEKFNRNGLSEEGIFAAIKEAYLNLDNAYKGSAGSTANVAIILNNELWVANVGDTRAVLNNGGTAIQLSEDQKCDNQKYVKGIVKRGGNIINVGIPRVNGNLAVPRAIGDHDIKGIAGHNCIVHSPKITKIPLSEIKNNSALILACDGVWDVCSSPQAVEFEKRHHAQSPDDVAEGLIVKAYNAGSSDNLSAMVIRLN